MGAPALPAAAPSARRNNFDVIRLAAAVVVLVSHGFLLSGVREPMVGALTLGQVAVLVFFGASGFLIAQSWDHDARLEPFLVKRALRIFPALFVVAFAAAFVVGPLVTLESTSAYFDGGEPLRYAVSNAFTFIDVDLPGVFVANPVMNVNGSLWTLNFELLAYLFVAAAGMLAIRRGDRWAVVALGAVLAICLALSVGDRAPDGNTLIAAFVVGAFLYRWRDAVPREPLVAAIGMAAFVGAGAAGFEQLGLLIGPFAVPYAVIVVAFGTPARWSERLRGHDLSYGIYLWGFLLQQTLVHAVPGIDALTLIALSVAVTVPVAAASWLLVERPVLRRKQRLASFGRVPGAGGAVAPVRLDALPEPARG